MSPTCRRKVLTLGGAQLSPGLEDSEVRCARTTDHTTTLDVTRARFASCRPRRPRRGQQVGIAVLDSGLTLRRSGLSATKMAAAAGCSARACSRKRRRFYRRLPASVGIHGRGPRRDDAYGTGRTRPRVWLEGRRRGAASRNAGAPTYGASHERAPRQRRVLDSRAWARCERHRGIKWVIKNKSRHIRVLIVARTPVAEHQTDPLCQAVERAVDAGSSRSYAAGTGARTRQGDDLRRLLLAANAPKAITSGVEHAAERALYNGTTSRRAPHLATGRQPDLVAPGTRSAAETSVTGRPRRNHYATTASAASPVVVGDTSTTRPVRPARTRFERHVVRRARRLGPVALISRPTLVTPPSSRPAHAPPNACPYERPGRAGQMSTTSASSRRPGALNRTRRCSCRAPSSRTQRAQIGENLITRATSKYASRPNTPPPSRDAIRSTTGSLGRRRGLHGSPATDHGSSCRRPDITNGFASPTATSLAAAARLRQRIVKERASSS